MRGEERKVVNVVGMELCMADGGDRLYVTSVGASCAWGGEEGC